MSWRDLPYHLKMDENVLLHALRAEFGPHWEDVPVQFHTNEEFLSVAVQYGKISFEDVPSDLQRNHPRIAFYGVQHNRLQADDCPCLSREFFKQVLEDGELDWGQLPTALQNDVIFALSISRFTEKELPRQILSHLVEIRYDQSFWRKLLHSLGKDFKLYFKRLMEEFAPPELCSDHDFMVVEMSRECTETFPLVDRRLASARGFLELALGQNAAVLQFLSHETQQLHRDLIIKVIPYLDLYFQ